MSIPTMRAEAIVTCKRPTMPFSTGLPVRDPGMVHASDAMPRNCSTESLRAWKAEKTCIHEYGSLLTNLHQGRNGNSASRTRSKRNRQLQLRNGAHCSRSEELHVCIVIGHHESQRQYGSGTYLTASQASVGRCSRGDDSSGRRDDSGGRAAER